MQFSPHVNEMCLFTKVKHTFFLQMKTFLFILSMWGSISYGLLCFVTSLLIADSKLAIRVQPQDVTLSHLSSTDSWDGSSPACDSESDCISYRKMKEWIVNISVPVHSGKCPGHLMIISPALLQRIATKTIMILSFVEEHSLLERVKDPTDHLFKNMWICTETMIWNIYFMTT